MARVPVADALFTWPSDDPQLIGSRCTSCGIVTFPVQESCPRCAFTDMEEHLLPRRGRLWAWTTQSFPPPSPPYSGPTGDAFVPYGIGYVELPGEVKVESRLTEADPAVLRDGMEMELAIVPFRTDDEGNEVVTFAFAPVGDAASGGGA
ncbi:MAG TPA: OB-fold domain-containing protein [Acidimicrobiia bacterium]|nr:OB-fold domain-containing protein [Acidimicrobiia bacterium]